MADGTAYYAEKVCDTQHSTNAVGIYSQDKGMEVGIEKCAMLVMKGGKQHMTDEMELPSQDKIRTFGENETYK